MEEKKTDMIMVPGSDLGITVEGKVIPGKKPSEHLMEKPMRRHPLKCTNSLMVEFLMSQNLCIHKKNEQKNPVNKECM